MFRPSLPFVASILAVVSLVALAGCSGVGSKLDGTRWRLIEWTVSSLRPGDFTITAQFADGRISGNSGVNTYGGRYRTGRGETFSVGPLSGTSMGGPEPAMRAEAAYLTLLGQARSYKMTAGSLVLYDKGRNESLLYEATRT